MKKILCIILLAILTLGLVACGADSNKSIVGKWEFGANVYEFKEDGSFSSMFNGMGKAGTYTAKDGKITLSYTNLLGMDATTELTYTLKDKSLTLTGDISLLGSMSMTVEFTKSK